MNIYQEHGYENRQDYLESLAESLGLEFDMVKEVAMLLGPSEDFDGLVTNLEDYAEREHSPENRVRKDFHRFM